MAKILPVEENFLLKFKIQNKPLTYPNFLRIWEYYDCDRSGRLERTELESFITDLIRTNRVRNRSDLLFISLGDLRAASKTNLFPGRGNFPEATCILLFRIVLFGSTYVCFCLKLKNSLIFQL